jgi:hypothetical protein
MIQSRRPIDAVEEPGPLEANVELPSPRPKLADAFRAFLEPARLAGP